MKLGFRNKKCSPCVSLLVVIFGLSLFLPTVAFAKGETITLAIHDSPWLPAYKKLMKMYEKKTGVKIEPRVYPHPVLYEKEAMAAIRRASTYDIMHMAGIWGAWLMKGKYVTPLKKIDPDFELPSEIVNFGNSARWSFKKDYYAPDGALYGIPVNGNLQIFFYRGDRFEQAGLSIPPKTFQDVKVAAKKLHNPPKFYGYTTITVAKIQAEYFWLPILWSFGGKIYANIPENWNIVLDSKETREALQFVIDMKKYCPPGIAGTSQSDVLSYLANGQLAQAINVAATYPYMDDPKFAAQPGKVDFTIVPMKKDIGKHIFVQGGWNAFIPVGAKHKKEALSFLKWTLTKEAQRAYIKAGGVIVNKEIYKELAATGKRKWRFCEAWLKAAGATHARTQPAHMLYPKVVDAIAVNFQKAITGELTVDKAVTTMAQQATEIMREGS